MRALTPLLFLGLSACTKTVDGDGDGASYEEDCNDSDASIFPGATEVVGDGIDSDCDGMDPSHAYVGRWQIDEISATWAGTDDEDIFDSAYLAIDSDKLEIYDNLAARLTIEANANGEAEYVFDWSSTGVQPGVEGQFAMEMMGVITLSYESGGGDTGEGGVRTETQHTASSLDLECTAEGDSLMCEGSMRIDEDDARLDTTATFKR